MRERLGLPQEQLARALNTADQSVQLQDSRGKTGRISSDARDLRRLLSHIDDYALASEKRKRLLSPLDAFGGRSPHEPLAGGRAHDLIVEFDRLREGQPV